MQGASETPSKRPSNSNENSESGPTTPKSRWSSRHKQSQHGSASQSQVEPSEPKPSSPTPQQPKKTARSGTLSVDEF
jgi:hypothetical protein